jgi:transcriptional regulator with XRE-family HTH domain
VNHFAVNLRRIRLEFKLSQAALAQRVGCRQSRVSELELGKFTQPTEITAFAHALGVDERDLLRRHRRIKSSVFGAASSARVNREPVAMTA